MTRLVPAALVLCAACSSGQPADRSAPAPDAGATPQPAAARPAATPADRDAAASPRPGDLKTFGDWAVGCDNVRRCELRSLLPDLTPPGGVTVSIAREAGPAGRLSVSIGSDEQDDLAASVDGKPADTPAALVAAMANGHALLARAAGAVVGSVSLKGASAALRYVDAMQGRAGTVTALVARGTRPASVVPAAAVPPTVVAVAPGGAALRPTPAQLAAMRRAATCETTRDFGAPEAHALGQERTLVLLPCSSGAYNLIQAVFVLSPDGFAAAKTDAPTGFDETGADPGSRVTTVVNGEFRDGLLTSYAKGRGLGDCGVNQELAWDGTRLRLVRQRAMGECRGNADYITTWRATVVRR